MKISLKNQVSDLVGPVRTTDARYSADALGDVLEGIESNLGMLNPGDLSVIKSVLALYCGGTGSVSPSGSLRASNDGARRARASVESVQAVAKANRDFWASHNAAELASIRR